MKTHKICSFQLCRHPQHRAVHVAGHIAHTTKSFETLYALHEPKRCSSRHRDEVVHRALAIYKDVNTNATTKDVEVITKLVKLCIDYEREYHFKKIWPDIITLHNNPRSETLDLIPYDLLFKCCIKSHDINKAIQILHWISSTKSRLQITDSFITKLIVKCSNDPHRLSDLHLIHSLLRSGSIQCQQYQYIETALITGYGKHHHLDDAKSVFDAVPEDQRDVFYVGAMMKTFIDNDHHHQALALYDSSTVEMDDLCHCMAIKACCSTLDIGRGQSIYRSLSSPNVHHKTAMIDLYAHCHQMDRATDLFRDCNLNEINIVTINTMISGYILNGLYVESLEMYDSIGRFGKKHNEISHNLALKACVQCGDSSAFERGKTIHRNITELLSSGNTMNSDRKSDGKLHRNRHRGHFVKLKSALIDFYGHFGDIDSAKDLFDSIPNDQRDIISVSAMMTAYIRNEFSFEVLELFETLPIDCRDGTAYNLALKACGHLYHHQLLCAPCCKA